MKYYLVALFDDESYKNIEPVQRNLQKRYKLPRHQPMLHIPLETIDSPNIEKLDEVLTKILKPYKKFKVELTGDICSLDSNNKFLTLKIQDKGYIKRIYRCINDMLRLHGFSIKENSNTQLCIPLSNVNNLRDSRKVDFQPKLIPIKPNNNCKTVKIDRIEIWKISNSRRETTIKSYSFRNY